MSSKPSQAYTMEQFISLGKTVTISYDKFSFKEILSNGTEISILNVVSDYINEMKQYAIPVKLSDKEYSKYRFKPKLLCHDVYDSPELYYVILLLNGIIDIKEFDFDTVLMLSKDNMNAFMSAIYNAEYKYIADYNGSHGTA